MQQYDIQIEGNNFKVDSCDAEAINLHQINADAYHLLRDNTSIKIQDVQVDLVTKQVSYRLNGSLVTASIATPLDHLIHELGLDVVDDASMDHIQAPMPGLVLDILVKAGDEVSKDDNLIILEAMKMENILKSPIDGKIKSVAVNVGDSVSKSDILIEYDIA